MKILKHTLCLFLLLLLTSISNCQQVRYLNIDDGLSNRAIFGIEKDRLGLLWIATNDGIDRYDGNEFRNYKLHTSSINPSDLGYRFNILLDTAGVIWAYTTSGKIFMYDQIGDRFELKLNLLEEIEINKTSFYVNTLYFDRTNTLWIGTTTGTYCAKFSGNKASGIYFVFGQVSHAFAESDSGYVWEGTEVGVRKLPPGNSSKKPDNDELWTATKGINVSSLFYDSENNRLWIGSLNNGPSVYELKTKKLIDLSSLVPHVPIRSIVKNSHNSIFIGYDGAGIKRLNALNYAIEDSWLGPKTNQGGLSDNSVLDILCDQEDRIWVCTFTSGITIIDLQKPEMLFLKNQTNNNNSLRSDQVFSTLEDSKGELWFGTSSGISILNRQSGTWDHLLNIQNHREISDYKILALAEDDRKRIWIGGYGNGLHVFDKKSRSITDLTKDAGTIFIGAIFNNHNNSMWFGGMEGKLSRMDQTTGKVFKYDIKNVTVITGKTKDKVWVGSTTGLFIADAKTNSVFKYSDFSGGLKEISNIYITCLYQDISGNLWIGTNGGGVNFFDPEKKQIMIISTEDGLQSNFIRGIFPDKNGRIWVCTDKGICCLNQDTKRRINFGFIDNFSNFPFSRNCYSAMASGDYVIGGYTGAIVFTPELIQPYISRSRLLLNEFKISYKRVLPGEPESPLTKPLNLTEKITLLHKQNSFSFVFSSIDYDDPSQLYYQWKLEGFEKEWSPLTVSKTAGYTNIPTGDYVFKLRCYTQNNLVWNDERTIRLTIRPTFWTTKIAFVFYILFLSGLVWMVYRIDQDKVQERHASDKIKFFINTTHDIKTPLSLIKAPLRNLESDKGITNQGLYFLHLAQSNVDKLSRIVNQVLDFEKAASNKAQLSLTNNCLDSYFKEKIESYQQLTNDNEIQFKYEIPDQDHFAYFDTDKMDKIIDNLFSNAVKYTSSGGCINFNVSVTEKAWTVEISDTGSGIPKNARRNLFKMYYRAENAVNTKISGTGIGLMLVRNYVKMHKGKISYTSQEKKGSSFFISFPRTIVPKNGSNQEIKTIKDSYDKNSISSKGIQVSQIPEISKSTLKILIVEDDVELNNYLACILGKEFRIKCAGDGLLALNLTAKEQFDLIISDVMMPNMRGDELCRRIKSDITTSHIPVVLLTALSDKKSTLVGFEAGADEYVEKPFDIEILLARLNSILKNRKLISESLRRGILPSSGKVSINGLDKALISKILSIVERELANPDFSIEDLCRETAMSRTLLYNKIKVHTNLAPNEFIRIIRMNKAMDLLKSGDVMISEIAEKVGFPDSKYFSTAFKKFFGKSPKHYLSNGREDIKEF